MIIVFDKKSKKVIGTAKRVLDNGKLRELTLAELYPNLDAKQFDHIIVDDNDPTAQDPRSLQVVTTKGGGPMRIAQSQKAIIQLTHNLLDQDGDGIVEWMLSQNFLIGAGSGASGTAATGIPILVSLTDENGKAASSPTSVKIRTNLGTLSHRNLDLVRGEAQFTFWPGDNTTLITLQVTGEDCFPAELKIEVIPFEPKFIPFNFGHNLRGPFA